MNEDLSHLLGALFAGLVTYGVMQSPACNEACQQFFGAALSESGKMAMAAGVAYITHQKLLAQPRQARRIA